MGVLKSREKRKVRQRKKLQSVAHKRMIQTKQRKGKKPRLAIGCVYRKDVEAEYEFVYASYISSFGVSANENCACGTGQYCPGCNINTEHMKRI